MDEYVARAVAATLDGIDVCVSGPVAPREDCVALFDAFRARHGGP